MKKYKKRPIFLGSLVVGFGLDYLIRRNRKRSSTEGGYLDLFAIV
jgi:hypothetical protein